MVFRLQNRLSQGASVQITHHAGRADLTLALQALLALIPPAASLAQFATPGRRGAFECIVATESVQALSEALDQVHHALDRLDLD
jgi:hypothetical protein